VAVTARIRNAWKQFNEYLPNLTSIGFSMKQKWKNIFILSELFDISAKGDAQF